MTRMPISETGDDYRKYCVLDVFERTAGNVSHATIDGVDVLFEIDRHGDVWYDDRNDSDTQSEGLSTAGLIKLRSITEEIVRRCADEYDRKIDEMYNAGVKRGVIKPISTQSDSKPMSE